MTADLIATQWRYLTRTRMVMPWRCRVEQMMHRSGHLGHPLSRARAERLLLFIGSPLTVAVVPCMDWIDQTRFGSETIWGVSLLARPVPMWNRRPAIMRVRSS